MGIASEPAAASDTLAGGDMGRVVGLAASGDEAAFARLVDAFHGDMTRVCFLITRDVDTAEDAVAAAWAIAWRRLRDVRDAARVRSWLISVAANEARRTVRRERRRAVVEIHAVEGLGDGPPDPARRATSLDLVNALARLKPEERALLALRYVAGFDATELGRATGMSPSGTRARLGRLLERLRRELHDG